MMSQFLVKDLFQMIERKDSRSGAWFILSVIEALTLFLGATLPIAKTSEFWIFENEFSLLSLTQILFSSGEILLGTILILFGFFIPIMKILLTHFDLPSFYRMNLHKFSMLDIFLLSFLVYSSKISNVFAMELKVGFYFLLISVAVGYLRIFFTEKLRANQ